MKRPMFPENANWPSPTTSGRDGYPERLGILDLDQRDLGENRLTVEWDSA